MKNMIMNIQMEPNPYQNCKISDMIKKMTNQSIDD